MSIPPHFQRFDYTSLEQAPESPGLYAWYGILDAGPLDWQLQVVDGQDAGRENFRRLLRDHTARHSAIPIEIKAAGAFAMEWTGSLEEQSNAELQELLLSSTGLLAQNGDDSDRAPRLQASIDAPELRGVLVKILQSAAPVLSSPLYIGVALNLRNRLEQHTNIFVKLQEGLRKEPEKIQKILSSPKLRNEFGVRAIRMGFTLETVEVWTLDLSSLIEHPSDPEQLRIVAEAAEWLLNRWHRPVLGRR